MYEYQSTLQHNNAHETICTLFLNLQDVIIANVTLYVIMYLKNQYVLMLLYSLYIMAHNLYALALFVVL